jgi:membrane fusion protein (multidrug efflux system)
MPTPFTRTLRSVHADGFRPGTLGALAAIALLVLWGTWLVRARVDVLATCPAARVEARGALYPIEAPVAGTVAFAALELGRAVRAGELLVELDGAALALEEAEQRGHADAAAAELAALEGQLASERRAAAQAPLVAAAVAEEDRLRRAEHALALELAREEVARLELLEDDGIVSELELVRARSLVRSRELALELQSATEQRRAEEELRAGEERAARTAGLIRELERQRGLLASSEARLARLAHTRAERRILAPHDGILAERRALVPGSAVQAGERLAALVAGGELAVVAEFPPADALGRLAAGQAGELRLDGFPWSRFGTVGVRVARVASEPRDGTVRVELAIERESPAIALQHGLPGRVEIVVERVSPAELVLRGAGLVLAGPRGARAP